MQNKKRILIFPFGLLSHYLRCTVLAKRLYVSDQYEVLFAGNPAYNHYVKEAGYLTFECAGFDADYVMKCSEKFDFSWLNETDIERIFMTQVKAIQLHKPDIVIGDVSPSLKMAAEFTGVEYHALMNGYMSKYYLFTRRLSRTHQAYKYSKKVPEKYFDRITDFAEAISFRLVHNPFKRLRKKYKLRRVGDYLSEMEGDRNLICDLPELFPQKELPTSYSFTGPLIFSSNIQEEEWLAKADNSKPVICVCMGSTGDWEKLRFLNNEYFARYTIIAGGDKKRVLSAGHIVSRDFLNLDQVFSLSNLMICHGGNGTIYHGLLHGIHMICYTSHFEQEWNVHALERIGYGVSANDFSIDDWKNIITATLSLKLDPFFAKKEMLAG